MVYNVYCWMVYGQTLHLLGEKKKCVSGWGVVRPQGLVNIDNSEKVELALYAHKDQCPYA